MINECDEHIYMRNEINFDMPIFIVAFIVDFKHVRKKMMARIYIIKFQNLWLQTNYIFGHKDDGL